MKADRPLTVNFTKCWLFARQLNELPVEPVPTEGDVEAILELVRNTGITYTDFQLLDEKPGRFAMGTEYPPYHRKLRYVRNHRNALFEILEENERKIRHHQLTTAVKK